MRVSKIGLMLVVISLLAACGKGGADTKQRADAPVQTPDYKGGPVELIYRDHNAGVSDEEFQEVFVKAVQAKYPDIKIKKVTTGMDELIASGMTPDLVTLSNASYSGYFSLDYPMEMTPMFKQFNIDLNKFEPTLIDGIRGIGKAGGMPAGALPAAPFGMNTQLLLYNKDIFDKFATEYPKDLMTWEDYLNIVKRLTRQDGGNSYLGGNVDPSDMLGQFGVSNFDEKGEKSILTSDGHKRVFSLLQRFYQIDGYLDQQNQKYKYGKDVFIKEQRLATTPFYLDDTVKMAKNSPPPFRWDMTSLPVFSERPNIGGMLDFHMVMAFKGTKNKEAVYRVILTLMSEETQLAMAKRGRLSALKDPKLKTLIDADSGIFKDKNLAGVFKVSSAPMVNFSPYNSEASTGVKDIINNIAFKHIDLNTAMRDGEMKANQLIRDKIGSKK